MKNTVRILVVEDNGDTRTLIKNQLVAQRLGSVKTLVNGAALLKSPEPVDAEIIILGMELENSHSGTDLVRHLSRLSKIPPWTKVIYVSNKAHTIRENLPMLGLKCEVIEKPINFKYLLETIEASQHLCMHYKALHQQLDKESDVALIQTVKQVPRTLADNVDPDDVLLIQARLLLRLRRPRMVLELFNGIRDKELKTLLQAHYNFFFGQQEKMEQALEQAYVHGILKSKRAYFDILHDVFQQDYGRALEKMEKFSEAELSPPEIALKASLLGLKRDLEPALEYLERKRSVTLENHYYRGAITITMMFLCLINQLVGETPEEVSAVLTSRLETLAKEQSFRHPQNDFDSFIPFILLAARVLNDEYEHSNEALFSEIHDLLSETNNLEPLKFFCLAFIYAHRKDFEKLTETLSQIALSLSDIEISPELIVNYLVYDLFFEYFFVPDERAQILNRVAIRLFDMRYTAMAIRLFYRAFKLKPDYINNTLNLLSALTTTRLGNYQDVTQESLTAYLKQAPLNAKQLQSFKQIHH